MPAGMPWIEARMPARTQPATGTLAEARTPPLKPAAVPAAPAAPASPPVAKPAPISDAPSDAASRIVGPSEAPRIPTIDDSAQPPPSELARNPGSAAAAYFLVVATRGSDEPIEAWNGAIAGWVRARMAGSRSAALRADLDKLVLEGIIPDRVRMTPAERREQAELDLRGEWAVVKERWK